MSVATLRPPAAIYREEQHFGWWVYALLALMVVLGWASLAWPIPAPAHPPAPRPHWSRLEVPLGFAVGLSLPALLVVGVLRMTTEVRPTECLVWFGWVPTYRRAIPLGSIQRLEVVRYRPLADCWGWGIRTGRDGERVLNARGDRGVRLYLDDGTRLLIGSQRPEELAEALRRSQQPVA